MSKNSASVRICPTGRPIFSSSCQLLLPNIVAVLNPTRARESRCFGSNCAASSGPMRCSKTDCKVSIFSFMHCCSVTGF